MPEESFTTAWRKNPEHYIVVRDSLDFEDGSKVVYHIFNVERKLSHIIESQAEAKLLGEAMIAGGVRVVTLEEAKQLLLQKHHLSPQP